MKKEVEYSVVVPVYNSCEGLKELYQEITNTFSDINSSYEVIFIDDFSTDNSWNILQEIKQENPDENIIIVNLMRNFGQHKATLCGIELAKGFFTITIDDDLQIQPKEIKKLIIKQKENNYDLVYGSLINKKHSKLKNIGSDLIKTQSNLPIEPGYKASSFRLFKTIMKENFVPLKYKTHLFIDEILLWNTGNIGAIEVEHHKRKYQNTSYSTKKLFKLGISFFIFATNIPLKLIVTVGFVSSIISFILGVRFIYRRLVYDIPLGYTSVIVTILFSTSLILLTLGILGKYLNEFYILLNKKPPYLINKIIK